MFLWEKCLLALGLILFILGIIAYWLKTRDLTEDNLTQLQSQGLASSGSSMNSKDKTEEESKRSLESVE